MIPRPASNAAPPRRTPGWVVVGGLFAALSAFLLFFAWLVWDSLVRLWERPVRDYWYF